jgi:methionyl-tRNA synthetase
LLGYEVKFSTGNDENSQKIVQQAEKEGKEIIFWNISGNTG